MLISVKLLVTYVIIIYALGSARQSAKTADWLVDNDVIWPVLSNCACANLRKLMIAKKINKKIDRSMAAEREREVLNYKDLQDCCSQKKNNQTTSNETYAAYCLITFKTLCVKLLKAPFGMSTLCKHRVFILQILRAYFSFQQTGIGLLLCPREQLQGTCY